MIFLIKETGFIDMLVYVFNILIGQTLPLERLVVLFIVNLGLGITGWAISRVFGMIWPNWYLLQLGPNNFWQTVSNVRYKIFVSSC